MSNVLDQIIKRRTAGDRLGVRALFTTYDSAIDTLETIFVDVSRLTAAIEHLYPGAMVAGRGAIDTAIALLEDASVPVTRLEGDVSAALAATLKEVSAQVRPIFLDADVGTKLDEIMLNPTRGTRHTSPDQTDECPVWNPFEGLWQESDEQLRERLRVSLAETET